MREHQGELEAGGALVAAIGLGGRAHARAFRQETEIGFPLLIDEDRLVYDRARLLRATLLSLLRPGTLAARRRARGAGHRQHRPGRSPFQLGGSFVFGPGDVDVFAHVSRGFGDNAAIEDLLQAVKRAGSSSEASRYSGEGGGGAGAEGID